MSKNVVDAVIDVVNNTNLKIGFIPSRRQVEYDGGYVNNWTTKSFTEYVKSKNHSIFIERDHGGPGQGYQDDDGSISFETDVDYFDIIHIDPWKKFQDYEDGLRETVNSINSLFSINPNCFYEIGTEESIRFFSESELEKLIVDLKKHLTEEKFAKIKYAVVQSGVGLDLGNQVNTGKFNPDRLQKMVNICNNHNLLSKEHNGDYLSLNDMQLRFNYGLNAINIAPEFGQFETDIYLDIVKTIDGGYFEDLYQICYKSKRWEKWVKPDFNPEKEKEKIIKISGHYIFSEPDFDNLKKRIAHQLEIDISILNERVKNKIKDYLFTFQEIIA
tara:strand:+ start:87 stop:1076 length:990 start_codon:yes stop_codon:yes gene_type:complete